MKSLMSEMVSLLQSESSSNQKMDILKEYSSQSPIIREAIKLCYNPFICSNIKKIKVPSIFGPNTFEDLFYEFKALYENLSSGVLSGNIAQDVVTKFLMKANLKAQDLFVKIFKKDLKVKIGASLINNALGEDFIPQFKAQLANPYDPNKKYKVKFWYGSPKLNGIRAYFDDRGFNSRKGHEFFGFDHIIEELKDLSNKYNLSFCDGELYNKGIPFQTIQSIVMERKKIDLNEKKRLKYNIFAVGSGRASTASMIISMEQIDWNRYKYLEPVKYSTIENNSVAIYSEMLKMYDDGYEGLMLRSPDVPYVYKRSNDLLKAKPFKEASFVIVGFEKGKEGTEIENTLGKIVVEGFVGDKKIRCGVGSGFKLIGEEAKINLTSTLIEIIEDGVITRDMIWRDKEKYLGKTCEVQFQEVTDKPDPNTGMYSLQFPVFVSPKLDR